MKKKSIILIFVVVLFCVFFLPIRRTYEDRVEYRAILYSVVTYQREKSGFEVRVLQHVLFQNVQDVNPNNSDHQRTIKVNGELYYETEFHPGDSWNSCGTASGKIKSHVSESEIPQNDDEANFEGDYEYQIMNENVIKICPGEMTIYFVKKMDSKPTYDSISDGTLDINSDFVQTLYEKVNPSHDASIIKGLYEKENVLANDYILSVGIVNLIKERFYRNEEYLKEEDVEDMIHQILGFQVKFVHQEVRVFGRDSFSEGICGYTYLPESHQYQLLHGCGGSMFESFARKVTSAFKEEDTVYITEKLIYKYNDWDDTTSKIYVYNNYAREKLLDYIVKDSNEPYSISLEDYIDDASTYVYVFKKQNGEYILDCVKRENP